MKIPNPIAERSGEHFHCAAISINSKASYRDREGRREKHVEREEEDVSQTADVRAA